jgi:hypothetical protein
MLSTIALGCTARLDDCEVKTDCGGYPSSRRNQLLFTYFHFTAARADTP